MRIRAPALPWGSLGPQSSSHPTYSDRSPFIRLPAPSCRGNAINWECRGKGSCTERGQGSRVRGDSTLTIPPNHLEVGVLLLDVVYHGDLIHRVPLG